MNQFKTLVEVYKNKEGVAQLFGILLYTDLHPHIVKVLRDDDYWRSFDELTGERFCVFSIKPAQGKYIVSGSAPGTRGMMIQYWEEPAANKEIINLLGINNTKNMPMLLLFTEIDGELLKIELELDHSSTEIAYNSIKKQLEFSSKALSQIKEENLNNPSGLYSALQLQVDDRAKWKTFKKAIDLYSYIKNILL